MCLVREALRMCVVRGLRADARLSAILGERIYDSQHGNVEDWIQDQARPSVIVYTDDADFGDGKDLLAGGKQTLTIQIVVTRRETEGADTLLVYPLTDAAMEFTIGGIERYVLLALTDPTNDWMTLALDFAPHLGEAASRRGQAMREGVRAAGREISIDCMVVKDPPPGHGPWAAETLWGRFLALAAADADLAPYLPVWQSLIAANELAGGELEMLQRAYGLTPVSSAALLMSPPDGLGPAWPAFSAPLPADDDAEVRPDGFVDGLIK